MLPQGLQALCAYRQFILYHLESKPDGKMDKVPYSPVTGQPCDAHNAGNWVDVQTAFSVLQAYDATWGVGFVLTEHDPFVCLDLDTCLVNGEWNDTAKAFCSMFPGSAVELSQSQVGLHLWAMCPVPPEHRILRDPNVAWPFSSKVEFYTSRRFIALTGNLLAGDAQTLVDLRTIADTWFKPQAKTEINANAWNLSPVSEWRGPTDDDDLIRRALNSKSANRVWGNGVTFADLWTGNADALGKRWPPDPKKATLWNESDADAALAAHLAFWTGRHHQRIAELMQRSALVRSKWEREDYFIDTIKFACAAGKDVLQDAPVASAPSAPITVPVAPLPPPAAVVPLAAVGEERPPSVEPPEGGRPISQFRQGRTMLGAEDQRALFDGCVYIRRLNRIYAPGATYPLDQSQFNATYGGRQFLSDATNGKLEKNAFVAFTQNQAIDFPRVDGIALDPSQPAGHVFTDDDQEWVVNIYVPPKLDAISGDVSLWWDLMSKWFSDTRDRDIFMAWVCALMRYPGVKFTWAPLIVAGEGCCKTLVFDAIRNVMGNRYTRSTRGGSFLKQFNDWIGQTLFCVVEDFRLPKTAERDELAERLKEVIAGGERVEAEGKGKDSTNVRNRCNFMFACNELDTLRIKKAARRWAPFVLGMWDLRDVQARGFTPEYVLALRRWIKSKDAIRALRHLFLTHPLPDYLNPTTFCPIAPTTTTEHIVYDANKDPVTELIEDAVRAGLYGFRGGWLTTDAVRALASNNRYAITPQAAGRLIERMGYVPHPALPDGWTHNALAPDNKKKRIYILRSSPHNDERIQSGHVVRLYTEAQEEAFESPLPQFGKVEVPRVLQ